MYGRPGITCGKSVGYSERDIAGVSAIVRIYALWPVDGQCICGLGRYRGLWLVGERGGEQLVPPSISLFSTPSPRLLSVFAWVLL